MDVKIIAFLVLLCGTPAEHVIEMPSMDDCLRASEFVVQARCLDTDEFAAHLAEVSAVSADRPTIPELAPGGALQNWPSATQRRLRNVMNPTPTPPTLPLRRSSTRKGAPS